MNEGPSRSDLLVVGGGLAAISVIRTLRGRGDARSIALLAEESGEPYDRPPLSKQALVEDLPRSAQHLLREGESAELAVDWHGGVRAVAMDSGLMVTTHDGRTWTADDVVVATGSRPRPMPEALRVPGTMTLRTREDAEGLRGALQSGAHLIVVGAGFIGLEVASSARERGCQVTVIEAAPMPLGRVLGTEVGGWFADFHRRRGVRVLCGRTIESAEPTPDGSMRLTLDDGEVIAGDAVLVGIGVLPATEWLSGAGLVLSDGVVCDEQGRASHDRVWAVGDVARWPHPMSGSPMRAEQWQSAVDQGRVVAEALCGEGSARWDQVPYFWSDQHGRKIQFAGMSSARHEVLHADDDFIAVMFLADDRAVGLLTVDRPRQLALGRRVLAHGGAPDEIRGLFG